MDQSEFSKVILKLKIAYQYFFKDMSREDIIGLTIMYKEYLSKYDFNIINSVIDRRIKSSRYMPTIAEMIEECNMIKYEYLSKVVDFMYMDGYFHLGFKHLNDEQANINKIKTLSWIEKDNLPLFLKEDIKYYISKYNQMLIANNKETLMKTFI